MKITPQPRPAPPLAEAAAAGLPPAQPLTLQPGDFYLEGARMVFTAAYHLRRGGCCGSRCRHCPYQQWPP
jgi:hypothetical protein